MNDYTYPGQRHCCAKARQMAGKWLKPFPPYATACKYFIRRT